jgi:hypothetical protein
VYIQEYPFDEVMMQDRLSPICILPLSTLSRYHVEYDDDADLDNTIFLPSCRQLKWESGFRQIDLLKEQDERCHTSHSWVTSARGDNLTIFTPISYGFHLLHVPGIKLFRSELRCRLQLFSWWCPEQSHLVKTEPKNWASTWWTYAAFLGILTRLLCVRIIP